jgi:CRP/FNR family cyclic AMP-dependent transcriptional regulator
MHSKVRMDTEQEKRALLENSRLFKEFDQNVIDAIIPCLTIEEYEANNLICLKGDESDCLYILREGEAEITVSSADGKIILLGILASGDVFGEVGLIDKRSRTASVNAKTAVSLYKLTSTDFDKLTVNFGVKEWTALTSYICFLFRGVTNNLEDTIFMDASVRVARKLYNLYEKKSENTQGPVDIEISQENLGRMAGLSREACNKALSRLEDQGLINLEYKKIIIPDIEDFRNILKD